MKRIIAISLVVGMFGTSLGIFAGANVFAEADSQEELADRKSSDAKPRRDPGSRVKLRRDPGELTICLQPFTPYDKSLLATASRGITYLYGFDVKILPAKVLPKSTYYKPRRRYRADKLIDVLRDEYSEESGCLAVMGFTKTDISTTKGEHKDWGVLGLAYIGGPSGMVSTYRMRKTSKRNRHKRVVKVVNHELGHILGLPHYRGDEVGCLMSDANGTVKTVDQEPGLLCTSSRTTIEAKHKIVLPERKTIDWKKLLGF